jgi:hypothetical protein
MLVYPSECHDEMRKKFKEDPTISDQWIEGRFKMTWGEFIREKESDVKALCVLLDAKLGRKPGTSAAIERARTVQFRRDEMKVVGPDGEE